MMGSATCNDSIETTKHCNGSKGIQGYGHLAWDPARKKNGSMKNTKKKKPWRQTTRSRTNPHDRNGTSTNEKKQAIRYTQHKNMTICSTKQDARQVYIGSNTWQGRKHRKTTQVNKFKWDRKLHITNPVSPHMHSLKFVQICTNLKLKLLNSRLTCTMMIYSKF